MLAPLLVALAQKPPPTAMRAPTRVSGIVYVSWNGGAGWWARFTEADSYVKGVNPNALRDRGYTVIFED